MGKTIELDAGLSVLALAVRVGYVLPDWDSAARQLDERA